MWLFFNDSMLSLTKPSGSGQDEILVRSRIKQDILMVFGDVEDLIEYTPLRDYAFRVRLSAKRVSEVVAKRITTEITYDNFKASISINDNHRHDVYSRVWSATRALQYNERHED